MSDPIKLVTLPDGTRRYRFRIDVGLKPDGRRDQRQYSFRTRKEAERERARILHEVGRGTYVKRNRSVSLQVVADQWLATKATRNRKASTIEFYRGVLVHVLEPHGELPGYGSIPVQALTRAHVEAVVARMRSGAGRRIGTPGQALSARTVNGLLTALTGVLDHAMAEQLVAVNVARSVARMDAEPVAASRDAWESADGEAFLQHVTGDRLRAAWMLSLLGLRRGEVLGLRWVDVDLTGDRIVNGRRAGVPTIEVASTATLVKGEVVTGSPKTRKSKRILPLPGDVADALREFRRAQAAERLAIGPAWRDTGLVVVDEAGVGVHPERYSDLFLIHSKAAGLPRLVLHGARHVAASLLANRGVPLIAAAAWLGQSQLSVTEAYQHAAWEQMIAASKTFGRGSK